MENFFEKEQTIFGTKDKIESNQFIAKDPKHGGSSCDYWYELIDNLNGKFFLIFDNPLKRLKRATIAQITRIGLMSFKKEWISMLGTMAVHLNFAV